MLSCAVTSSRRRSTGVPSLVGPAADPAASLATIPDEQLLDKRGRPLRGAARAARIAAKQRKSEAVPAELGSSVDQDVLLDRRGRPLRGAALAARVKALERQKLTSAPSLVVETEAVARPVVEAEAVAPLVVVEPEAAVLALEADMERIPSAVAPTAPLEAVRVEPVEAPPQPGLRARATRLVRSLRATASALPEFPSLRMPALSMGGLRLLAITVTMTFVFATIIGTTGLVSRHGTIALGASTTLTIISGEVTARASDADAFQAIADGATLHAGMTVRTGPGSYAVLTYFEGSTVSLDPNTTLVIEALEAEPDGSTIISMREELGRTWHSVAHLLTAGSRYEVKTPTATATVRGTEFEVGVQADPDGQIVSTVETVEGAVATSKAPTPQQPQPAQEVLVRPGFEVAVTKDAPLTAPVPAPPPQRVVTVTVGAAAGVVLDPLGRANGIKDGRLVVQTPGAVVQKVNGQLVITLPDIPDGKLAAVVAPTQSSQAPVNVATTVVDKGKPAKTVDEQVAPASPNAAPVLQIDVSQDAPIVVTPVAPDQQKKILDRVKVAAPPPVESVATAVTNGSSGDQSAPTQKDGKRGGPPGGGGPGGGAPGAGGTGAGAEGAIPGSPAGAGGSFVVVRGRDGAPISGFVPQVDLAQIPSVVTALDVPSNGNVAQTGGQGAPSVSQDSGQGDQGDSAPKGPDQQRAQPPSRGDPSQGRAALQGPDPQKARPAGGGDAKQPGRRGDANAGGPNGSSGAGSGLIGNIGGGSGGPGGSTNGGGSGGTNPGNGSGFLANIGSGAVGGSGGAAGAGSVSNSGPLSNAGANPGAGGSGGGLAAVGAPLAGGGNASAGVGANHGATNTGASSGSTNAGSSGANPGSGAANAGANAGGPASGGGDPGGASNSGGGAPNGGSGASGGGANGGNANAGGSGAGAGGGGGATGGGSANAGGSASGGGSGNAGGPANAGGGAAANTGNGNSDNGDTGDGDAGNGKGGGAAHDGGAAHGGGGFVPDVSLPSLPSLGGSGDDNRGHGNKRP